MQGEGTSVKHFKAPLSLLARREELHKKVVLGGWYYSRAEALTGNGEPSSGQGC